MTNQTSWAERRWWRGTIRSYVWVLLVVLLIPFALHLFTIGQLVASPLQQFYIQAYRTSCAGVPRPLGLPYIQRANGVRTLASISDVVVLPPTAAGGLRIALADTAIRSGAKRVEFLRTAESSLAATCAGLDRQIQLNARNVPTSVPHYVVRGMMLGILGFIVGIFRSVRSHRAMRRGHTLRGPELLSCKAFKRLKRGDGVAFAAEGDGGAARVFRPAGRAMLAIRRHEESSHFLLMGDTGTGKSSLIRQLLDQVAERDEAAIVYDPALEFTTQFFRPERGDRILNPLDTRMPYWCPGDEIQHRAEALTFAKALFPEDRRDNRFFIESPRKIFASLLSFKPTAREIARWLQHPAEIDRLLRGTELASMIDPLAPSQRAGVLASLSMVGDSFNLVPDESETSGRWSAHEWAQHRRGWLFLTSTPQTIDRLRPLLTVWFDLLLMRLLSGGPPVWVFLDELPTLNKLPKLPEALALARKPNVRLVLGFQGRAQLEARYGPESEAMLSQPATKVFLRTSEPRAADWISKALGEMEHERLRESVNYDRQFISYYRRKGHGFSLDRQTKFLVLASEIAGLSNLTAYLKSENYVIKFRFLPNPVKKEQPALLLRPVRQEDWPQRPAPDSPSDPVDQARGPTPRARAGHRLTLQPCRDLPVQNRPETAVERDPYFE